MVAQSAEGRVWGGGSAGRRQTSGAASQSRRERWDWTAVRTVGLRTTAADDLSGPWVSSSRAAPGSEGWGPRAIAARGATRVSACCLLVESRGGQGLPRRLSRNSPLRLWTEIH